jgi:hypothetical protein
MLMKEPVLRRSAAVVLALVALVGAGNATAKIFTTSATVQDFRFDPQGLVLYTNPSLDQVSLELTPDNQVVINSMRQAEFSLSRGGNVVGSLNLGRADRDGKRSWDYMIFGSLPPSDESSTGKLVRGSLDAMQSAPEGDSLSFLFVDGPTTGMLGGQYASIGIFAHVAGLDVEEWTRTAALERGSIMNLLAAEPANAPNPAQQVPLPTTPLLLLAGLLGLRYVRRRR